MPHDLELLEKRMRDLDLITEDGECASFLGFIFGKSQCSGSCSESCTTCQAGNSAGPTS